MNGLQIAPFVCERKDRHADQETPCHQDETIDHCQEINQNIEAVDIAPPTRAEEKVGSDPKAARKVGGKMDFGVPETGRERDRQYTSQNTKASDRGATQARGGTDEGRTSGVGGRNSGQGSSSGGDVDTDMIGVGTGGTAISASGPDDRTEGADMISGDDPIKGRSARSDKSKNAKRKLIDEASVVDRSGGDRSTTNSGQGAAAVTNAQARDDDSFAGEVSMDEASGADNSPSDRG